MLGKEMLLRAQGTALCTFTFRNKYGDEVSATIMYNKEDPFNTPIPIDTGYNLINWLYVPKYGEVTTQIKIPIGWVISFVGGMAGYPAMASWEPAEEAQHVASGNFYWYRILGNVSFQIPLV